MTYIKQICGSFFLMKDDEFIESFDTRQEAELAFFDATRKWDSLYDKENTK